MYFIIKTRHSNQKNHAQTNALQVYPRPKNQECGYVIMTQTWIPKYGFPNDLNTAAEVQPNHCGLA